VTPEALEYEIRMLPGVIACSITGGAVTVLASPSADAAGITESAKTLAAIAGIGAAVVVIGGVGTIAPRSLARLKAPAAVGATLGIGSLLAAAVATAVTGGVAWIPGVTTHETAAPRPVPAITAPPQQVASAPTPGPQLPRTTTPASTASPAPAPPPVTTPLVVEQPPVVKPAPAPAVVPAATVRTVPISATKPVPAPKATPVTVPVATPVTAPTVPPVTTPPVTTPATVPPPAPDEDSRRVAAATRRDLKDQAHTVHQQSEVLEHQADQLHDEAKKLRDRAKQMLDELHRRNGDPKVIALTGAAKVASDNADQVVLSQVAELTNQAQRLETAADGLDANAQQLASQARQLRDRALSSH
jgi:hypothetical protein